MHMANEQYQQNSHKWKTWQLGFQTLERYRYWASFQVTGLFHSATNFFNQADYYFLFYFIYLFFFWGGGGGVLSPNAFTIWCCIPMSRLPKVIRRFKRRSCSSCDQAALRTPLSVCLSATPFSLCSWHHITTKFSGVITNDKSDVHAKGQGHRSNFKVTRL